ncbi:solute carrier family 35, member C2 [Kwoniella heveanensis CBS 569]|nr:solute carrier family 35, member C2 [Kwoniella heveanensis CBS 569]
MASSSLLQIDLYAQPVGEPSRPSHHLSPAPHPITLGINATNSRRSSVESSASDDVLAFGASNQGYENHLSGSNRDGLPAYDDGDGDGDDLDSSKRQHLLSSAETSRRERDSIEDHGAGRDRLGYDRHRRSGGDTGVVGTEPGHERHRHASVEMKKALWWKNVVITGIFVLSWYTFATLLSLYNKWMFSPQYYGFSYPLFVTACHMVVQFFLASFIRVAFAKQYRPKERPTRKEYVTKILPTAASTGGDIGLSNLSLKTITLSLYTMCKSSTLIFVLLFAFAFKLEKYSLRLISVISLISFGVFCMVFNTTAVSIPGIVMVFVASGLGGLRWALTELVMHKKGMGLSNPFATIFWLAPLMAITLAPVSMALEGWFTIFGGEFFTGFQAVKTIGVIVFPGALAFAMVASEYFIIQRAGVVPLSIAGIFKEVSTISISAWVFGDQLTSLNIVGVVITIGGIALYSFHKYQKSISSTVELDAHGNPVKEDDTAPLMGTASHRYVTASQNDRDGDRDQDRILGDIALSTSASGSRPPSAINEQVPLDSLNNHGKAARSKLKSYPYSKNGPEAEAETDEERTNRLRDDFEGWDRPENDDWSGSGSDDEEEADEVDTDEVDRRRNQRLNAGGGGAGSKGGSGRSRWGEWWDKAM